jgi:hypothetical protein
MALIPGSARPIWVRKMNTDERIVEFIEGMRQEHPRIGKEKLKPLLDDYCKGQRIPTISESTIGKIIKEDAGLLARFTSLMLSSEKVDEFNGTRGEQPSLQDATLVWLAFRTQEEYLFSPFGHQHSRKSARMTSCC